jgi:hypothetical protein
MAQGTEACPQLLTDGGPHAWMVRAVLDRLRWAAPSRRRG